MKAILLAASAAFIAAAPAAAQTSDSYTGGYVGGRIGYAFERDRSNETVLFDTNLDGNFGDTVRTGTGANAFSPGFCPGNALGNSVSSFCDEDGGGKDYAVHAGYDVDFGGIVVGALVEYGESDLTDRVTAFSTTPASYTLTRKMKGTFGARARVGYNVGGFLPYVTGGVVRAKIRSSFATSNTANGFATQDASGSEWGYRVGGGVEKRFGPIAIGAQYLYTRVNEKDFRVNVTRGTAPVTNPFLLVNANGTQFRRSQNRLQTETLALTGSFRF